MPGTADFWLTEGRSPEGLRTLVEPFPHQSRGLTALRPLLAHAMTGDTTALRVALDAEMRAEQAADRAYWEPVRRELEAMRLEEARRKRNSRPLV